MSRTRISAFLGPEPLEARVAPASLTFTSATNGSEQVVINVSKGTTADLLAAFSSTNLITEGQFGGDTLDFSLDLHGNTHFRGADVSVTTSGGASVFLHELNATGFDLGAVSVPGELGQIIAGDKTLSTPAVKSISVSAFGTTDHLTSTLHGSLSTLHVAGDMGAALILETKSGSIKTLQIDGALAGSNEANSGSITAAGSIKFLTVTEGLTGSGGVRSGSVYATGNITSAIIGGISGGGGQFSGNLVTNGSLLTATINGSISGSADPEAGVSNGRIFVTSTLGPTTVSGALIGGSADESGSIAAGRSITSVTVAGGLQGGAGMSTGTVGTGGTLTSVTIGNADDDISHTTVQGGSGYHSGSILSTLKMGTVFIHGNIEGGSGPSSGEIASAGTLSKVTVNGSVGGGTGANGGSIGSTGALGSVTILGSLTGGSGNSTGQIISAKSIESVQVLGSVTGSGGFESGAIGSPGSVKTVNVGQALNGGSGQRSGLIVSNNTLGNVSIGTSVVGYAVESTGDTNARIEAPTISKLTIGRDLLGGAATNSGTVQGSSISSVTVQGQMKGGSGIQSGSILAGGDLQRAVIVGDVTGGNGEFSGTVQSFSGRIVSVEVDGHVQGGNGHASGSIIGSAIGSVLIEQGMTGTGNFAGSIFATDTDITSVVIHGTLASTSFLNTSLASAALPGGGNSSNAIDGSSGGGEAYISAERNIGSVVVDNIAGNSSSPVYITAGGRVNATTDAQALAIGSVTTKESMAYTKIIAGAEITQGEGSTSLTAANGHVKIGTVEVGTDGEINAPWQNNDVLAGTADPGTGAALFNGGNPALLSSIAKVIIHGTLVSSIGSGHGIVAQLISSVKANDVAVALTPGPGNDVTFFPTTTDTFQSTVIYEIGAGSF